MRLRALRLLAILCLAACARGSETLPYRGLAIAAPKPEDVDRFIAFMDTECANRGVNLMVLRVDYNYAYERHPELRADDPLSRQDADKLARAARRNGIRLVPQINLLGHQSWAGDLGNLLRVYPQFDETPRVAMPDEYAWPNEDGLYCKSYCPLHPEVHDVVFALVDEALGAFQADAFHAGMDEVFYLGDDDCPRCAGKDKAQLFAGEVAKIHAHLAQRGSELWIWGDRLLDAETTGLGMWEASANGTARAIDLIPRDVVICDWHYERAEPTPAYFAVKGFRVLACSWNKPAVARAQLEQARAFRAHANPTLAQRHLGAMHTYWADARSFLDHFQDRAVATPEQLAPILAFEALFPKLAAAPQSSSP